VTGLAGQYRCRDVELCRAAGRFPGEVILSVAGHGHLSLRISSAPYCRAAGLMPINGGGNLITLSDRDGVI